MFVSMEVNTSLTVLNSKSMIKTGTSIRFLINGVDQGEAINNAKGDMYPVVELGGVRVSVMS
jgi:hypothetical protein